MVTRTQSDGGHKGHGLSCLQRRQKKSWSDSQYVDACTHACTQCKCSNRGHSSSMHCNSRQSVSLRRTKGIGVGVIYSIVRETVRSNGRSEARAKQRRGKVESRKDTMTRGCKVHAAKET